MDTFTIAAKSNDPMKVRRLGFGAMRITGPGIWGPPADRENAREVLRQAVSLGVDFIDTADSYGPGDSEEIIAEALWPYEGLTIATKGGLTRQGPDQWAAVGAPNYLKQALEMSLRRLRVERIDLYQLHRIDDAIPLADQLGVFVEAQAAGKIRHIGISEVTLEQYRECQEIADIVTVQNLYNVGNRQAEDLLDACEADGVGFIPWFPIGGRDLAAVDSPLQTIAARTGHTASQLALAWLLQRSPVMLPIPGTGSLAHLAENCAAGEVRLSAEVVAELDAIAGRE